MKEFNRMSLATSIQTADKPFCWPTLTAKWRVLTRTCIYYSGRLTTTPLNILLTFRFRREKKKWKWKRKHLPDNKNKSVQIMEIKQCGKLIRSNEALRTLFANDSSEARQLEETWLFINMLPRPHAQIIALRLAKMHAHNFNSFWATSLAHKPRSSPSRSLCLRCLSLPLYCCLIYCSSLWRSCHRLNNFACCSCCCCSLLSPFFSQSTLRLGIW